MSKKPQSIIHLMTAEGEALQKDPVAIPWNTYPRPQMKREAWENLNGTWEFSAGGEERKILVPFAPESRLSGIGEHFPEGSFLYYRKQFRADPTQTGRFLLHFGAVSQYAKIYVNQTTGDYTLTEA